MGEKVSDLKQSADEIELHNARISFNSLSIKRQALSILFFPIIFVAIMVNLQGINFVYPPFEQLSTTSGVIKFTSPLGTGPRLYLDDGQKKKGFDNLLQYKGVYLYDGKDGLSQYRGKTGKAWWYRTDSDNYGRIFLQFEVEGKIVMSYQKEKEKHFEDKKSGRIFFFVVVTVYVFLFIIIDKPMRCKVSKLEPKK
jgi:hypothetical protein